MGYLRKRFGEPSTHAGVGMVLMGASVFFPQYGQLLQALGVALGVTAAAIPEQR